MNFERVDERERQLDQLVIDDTLDDIFFDEEEQPEEQSEMKPITAEESEQVMTAESEKEHEPIEEELNPEPARVPEIRIEPEQVTAPEVQREPELVTASEVRLEPERAAVSEAKHEPEQVMGLEVQNKPEPEIQIEPERVTAPEAQHEPETIPAPEVRIELKTQKSASVKSVSDIIEEYNEYKSEINKKYRHNAIEYDDVVHYAEIVGGIAEKLGMMEKMDAINEKYAEARESGDIPQYFIELKILYKDALVKMKG